MKKAVFLDRDGVINAERGDYTWKKSDFVFNPDIKEALQQLKHKGFLLIIITNQGGIAKKIYSNQEFLDLTQWMLDKLNASEPLITDFYYCPHHPQTGLCLCRKPLSLLIERAVSRYQIDPSLSFMIGDQDRDVEAAEKLGIKSIKIRSNSSLLAILEEIC